MPLLHALVHSLDAFTDTAGRLLSWLCLAMAVLTALIVILRYGFNVGSIAAQEAVIYMHGCLFMLGAAYTLKAGAHVRVDIFYQHFGLRARAWVNALGGIVFAIPVCLFIIGVSVDYVANAWAIRESSPEPGGIPAVYLLKTLLPLMGINLLLQVIAEVARNTLVLIGESST